MTNIQNIERPQLFTSLFHLLITFSNEVVDYIKTTNHLSNKSVTSKVSTHWYMYDSIKKTINNFVIKISLIDFLKRLFHE